MKTLTVGEQRERNAAQCMVGIGLEAHLRNLVREVLAGDTTKLVEFQQFLRYAPPVMVARVQDFIEKQDFSNAHNISQVG